METSKKLLAGAIVSVVLVTGLLVRFGAVASGGGESGVSVSMPTAKTLQVFLGRGETVSLGESEEGNMQLGSAAGVTTNLTALELSEDLTVNGTTTFNGAISGGAVQTVATDDFTSSGSSQTLCSVRNDSGADRILSDVSLLFTTSTVTSGSFGLTISQSSTAAATGTGSNIYFQHSAVSIPTTGLYTSNATSSIAGYGDGASSVGPVKAIWRAGSYINFLLYAPTSTLTGTCRVPSY